MLFRLLALIVLLLFYGIYFTKMLIQKKQGIQTRQIGKRKEKELHRVELWMSAATLLAPAAQLLSIVLDWSWLPDAARWAGFGAGLLGDLIFGIAVVTMKNSWRAGIPDGDKTELIQDGLLVFVSFFFRSFLFITIDFSRFSSILAGLKLGSINLYPRFSNNSLIPVLL